MTTALYINTAQFMELASTGVTAGQKAKKYIGMRKTSDMMLMAKPYRPRDHLRGGSGSPFSRLQTRQAIVIQ